MKLYFLLPSIALLNLSIMSFAVAQTAPANIESDRKLLIQKLKSATNRPEQKIVELSEVTFPSTKAELLDISKIVYFGVKEHQNKFFDTKQ